MRNIRITVLTATNDSAELEVTSNDHTTTYADVTAAIEQMLAEEQSTWTVDADISRVGVGITADGKGMGHAAKFYASISR